MSKRHRQLIAQAANGTSARTVAAPAPAANAGAQYMIDLTAALARGSFAMITNPRRRRLRKGDGGYHCDYRTVEELRNISRWLEYHSGTYGGMLNNWCSFLVGAGPAWVPASADAGWNRLAAEAVRKQLDAKAHDVRKKHGWGAWIKLLARSIVRDGMMGIVHTAAGAAQLIEAERILSVHSTAIGQVVDYEICNQRLGSLDLASRQPIPAGMMDLPAVITRTSQDLGIPLCFSSLDDHDGISDLWQAEIDASAESVRPWLRIKHKDGGLPGGVTIPQALAAGQPAAPIPAAGRDSEPAGWIRTPNGNIMALPPGLEADVHQPDRPNINVPDFCKQVIRVASMVLLPYELLFVDQADVSYSNGRMIRKIGNSLLDAFRSDHLNAPLTRIIHGILRGCMLRNEIPTVSDWRNGSLEWDAIPEHDRIKERQADTIDLANGTASLKRLKGEAWQPILEERATEYAFAAELVAAHNLKFPAHPITIAHLMGDPAHLASLAVSFGASADQATQPRPAPAAKSEPKPAVQPAAEPVGAGA